MTRSTNWKRMDTSRDAESIRYACGEFRIDALARLADVTLNTPAVEISFGILPFHCLLCSRDDL